MALGARFQKLSAEGAYYQEELNYQRGQILEDYRIFLQMCYFCGY